MIKMSQSSRLPLAQIKGSMSQRFAKSEVLADKFFNTILSDYKDQDKIHVIELKNVFNKTLGRHVNIVFNKLPAGETSSAGIISLKGESEVCGYSLTLPMSKDNKVSLFSVSSLMHEVRHVFDYLTAPKVLTRQLAHERTIPETVLFNTVLAAEKDFNAQKLTSWLEHCFSPEDIFRKINFLQSCRHNFMTEKNAYEKEIYYLQKFITDKKGIDFNSLMTPRCEFATEINRFNEFLTKFNIDGKLEALNNELAKALKEAREMIKINNSN